MIVAGISMVVLLGVMAIFNYQAKVSKTADVNSQIDDIKRQIQVWIGTQSSCNFTFKGMKNGDSLIGFKSKNDGNNSDYLLQTGQRFPATNWTIQTVQMLTASQVTSQFPQFSPVVASDGTATGVLKVTLAQLQGSAMDSTNTTLQTTPGGTFGSLSRIIYLPIPAIFGTPVIVNATSCSRLDPNDSSGACCLGCTRPGGGTYSAYVTGLTGVAYNATTNPIYFTSDYDSTSPPNYGCTPMPQPPPGITTYMGTCYVYNYNLPVLACNAAIRDPMKQQ